MKNTKKINKDIVVFIILLFFLLDIFFPFRISIINLKIGDVAKNDIVAPFTFPIMKDPETLEKERTEAALSIPPVLRKVERSKDVNNQFASLPGDIKSLKKTILYLQKKGIVFDKGALPESKDSLFEIISSRGSKIVNINQFFSFNEARNILQKKCLSIVKDTTRCNEILGELEPFIQPNLLLDITETQKRREAARNRIPSEKGRVKKGEIIVRAHDIVDEETYQKLLSLKYAENNLYRVKRFRHFFRAQFILLILCIIMVLLLEELWKDGYTTRKKRNVILILTLILLIFFRFVQFLNLIYLFPLAAAAMVLTLEGGILIGLIYTIFFLCATYVYNPTNVVYLVPLLISGLTGAVVVKKLSSMSDFFKTGMVISVVTTFLVLGNEILTGTSTIKLLAHILSGIANGGESVILLVIMLILFERLFHISTDFTYIELANLNHPILSKLSIMAPGTYHHSIMVGNLAEAAAEAIGANPLLAKVGGYYHDIGKMTRPEYFVENLDHEFNPHDGLPPKLSVAILKSHVSEGISIAKEHHLPESIIKIIMEHHGTSLIKPFYEKAKDLYDVVNEEDFRYDGPIPSSRESSIIMLADAVEAASKSVEISGEESVRTLVEKIIDMKMRENQLDNGGLSITELKTIADIFTKRLKAVKHTRPSYPRVHLT